MEGPEGSAAQRNNVVRPAALSGRDKSFWCDYEGCGKSFTRAEHLQRHALNHTTGGQTCSVCRAHFKRPDLLSRQMFLRYTVWLDFGLIVM